MSLFEVQAWLGHKHPASTQHYAKVNPAKLTRSYEKAGYFERNVRAIDVLIDQETVWKGLADKEPWKYFDLGHGFLEILQPSSLISVRIGWHVLNARSTSSRARRRPKFSKRRGTFCKCARRYRCRNQSWRP